MRILGSAILAFVLVACAPTVPDSAAGVGFAGYSEYELERLAREKELERLARENELERLARENELERLARAQMSERLARAKELERLAREKELAGTDPIVLVAEISDEIIDTGIPVPTTSSTAISQVIVDSPTAQTSVEDQTAQTSVEDQTAQTSVDTPTIQTAVDKPTTQVNVDNPTISDEQNFDAVAARETIESDAERLAAQALAYQVIEPTALPTRAGGSEPSIVEFALATTNLVGQAIYSRSIIGAQRRFNRNCAKYPSSDMAQADFLKLGGPKRDRKGLDPDGDGFACYWDPAPFRQAVQN